MSHGFSSMQRWILDDLSVHIIAQSTDELFARYMREQDAKPSRNSARQSMTRALRSLKLAGKIELKYGKWQPVGAWPARDAEERERKATAYHEAGHAVIGLAGQLPIAFITIRAKGSRGGYVCLMHGPKSVGYVVKNYRIIADDLKTDAFGNLVREREITDEQHHAEIRCDIGGPMAEAHLAGDYTKWRKYASSADMSNARWRRRQLGDRVKDWAEYEAETYALICAHWDMIEAVTARLLLDETISGPDVDDICVRIARCNLRRTHTTGSNGTRRATRKIAAQSMAA